MKLLKQGLLIVVMVGGLLAGLQPTAEASIDGVSIAGGCSSATLIINYSRWSEARPEEIVAYIALGDAVNGQTGPTMDEAGAALPVNPTSGQVTITLNFPEQPAGTSFYIFVRHQMDLGGEDTELIDWETLYYECGFAPGCDVLNNIPEQAVVGLFTANSEIYWAPGESVVPMIYVEAGNTYYVAGQDESETYYKVLISCNWVWVRKTTVGPNPDEVWQNAPLPTTIVE